MPARAIGIPAVVPRGHLPLVRDVDQHPGQALQRVDGRGPRRRPLGLVGVVGHGLGGPVIREPLQRDRIPGAVAREPAGEGAVILGHPHRRIRKTSRSLSRGSRSNPHEHHRIRSRPPIARAALHRCDARQSRYTRRRPTAVVGHCLRRRADSRIKLPCGELDDVWLLGRVASHRIA